MTLKKAMKESFGSELETQVTVAADGTIDFSTAKTQSAIRKALLDALRKGGFAPISLMVGMAWKTPTVAK